MLIIKWIWIAIAGVWLIAAARSKTTVQRQSLSSRFVHSSLLVLAVLMMTEDAFDIGFLGARFVPAGPDTIPAGIWITAAGATIAVWARVTIGSNWSGVVTVKQDHELIRSGPYRLVRHPIYSGLLLSALGTAIAVGQVRALVAVGLGFLSFWWKSRLEESFMLETFGERYQRYRDEVKALIPFVL